MEASLPDGPVYSRSCVENVLIFRRAQPYHGTAFLDIVDGSSTDMSGGYDSDPWPTKKLEI